MYKSIESFLRDYEHEFISTNKYLSLIENESLEIKIHDSVRTIGWLSWHIVSSIPEMLYHAGLNVSKEITLYMEQPMIKEMQSHYSFFYQNAIDEIKNNWKDSDLSGALDMYGKMWKKGTALTALLFHQFHHRNQLGKLIRLAGYKILGITGPSKEEWLSYGLELHK